MAWFQREQGVAYTRPSDGATVVTERGFLVYGGESLAGGALDDLWLFDIGRLALDGGCPWSLLSSSATPTDGIAGGLLAWDDGGTRFFLMSGRTWDGTGWRPSPHDFELNSLVSPSFVLKGTTPLQGAYAVEVLGDYRCVLPQSDCSCATAGGCSGASGSADEGDYLNTWALGDPNDLDSRRRAVCEQAPRSPWEDQAVATPDLDCVEGLCDVSCSGGALGGCAIDPFCARSSDYFVTPNGQLPVASELIEGVVQGLHDFGGAWDPVDQRALVYGGAVGCTGSACDSVTLFNGDVGLATDLGDALAAIADGDGRLVQDLKYGANSPSLQFARPQTSEVEWLDGDGSIAPAGTLQATTGYHGAALAVLGVAWDFDGKVWQRATESTWPELAVWGGTRHQDIVPSSQVVLLDTLGNAANVVRYLDMDQSSPTDVGMMAGGAAKLKLYDFVDAQPRWQNLAGGDNDGIVHAAAVGIGPTRLATLGGIADWTSSGSGSLLVLGDDGAIYESVTTLPGGYGAAGVYDPIDDRAYFFGAFEVGNATEQRVIELQHLPNAPRFVEQAAVEVERSELQLRVENRQNATPTGGTERWLADIGMRVRVDTDPAVCSGSCYTDRLSFEVAGVWYDDGPTGHHTDDIEPQVWLKVGGTEVAMERVRAPVASGADRRVEYRSPVSLVTGESYDIRIALNDDLDRLNLPNTDSPDGGFGWHTYGYAGSCGTNLWVTASAWPAFPVSGGSAGELAAESVDYVFEGLQVGPSSTWEVMAPGSRDADCTVVDFEILDEDDPAFAYPEVSCFRFEDVSARSQVRSDFPWINIVEHATYLGERDLGAADGEASVWLDPCLADKAIEDHVRTYMDAHLRGDAEFLAARIGTGAADGAPQPDRISPVAMFVHRPVVFIVQYPGLPPIVQVEADTVGTSAAGFVLIHPFAADGASTQTPVKLGGPTVEDHVGSVVTHELAHVLTERRTYQDGAEWISEAVPSLLNVVRYPEVSSTTLLSGQQRRIEAWSTNLSDIPRKNYFADMELPSIGTDPDAEFYRTYQTGPFLLAMGAAMSGRTDGDSLWPYLESLYADGDYRSAVSTVEVRAWFDAAVGTADGYDTYVRGLGTDANNLPLFGQPLLGLGAVSNTEVEVVQVQGNILAESGQSFSRVFPEVPYMIGCESDAGVPFAECASSHSALVPAATVATTSVDRVTIALTVEPGFGMVDTGVNPAVRSFTLALLGPSMLLPDGIPAYGSIESGDIALPGLAPGAATWFLVCEAGYLGDPACMNDADGDGWPDDGDCGPQASVHPAAVDPPPGSVWADPATALPVGVTRSSVDFNCDGLPIDWWSL